MDEINAGRPQCPVGLNTLVIPRKVTLGDHVNQPYVYLNCGHVQGKFCSFCLSSVFSGFAYANSHIFHNSSTLGHDPPLFATHLTLLRIRLLIFFLLFHLNSHPSRTTWMGPGEEFGCTTMPNVPWSWTGGDALHGHRASILCRLWSAHIRLQSLRSYGHREDSKVSNPRDIMLWLFDK